MVNSFLKSLPSQKKKRKLHHRERRGGSQEGGSQKSENETTVQQSNPSEAAARHPGNENSATEELSEQSLLSDTESCVPGTECQYPIASITKHTSQETDDETVGMRSPLSGRSPVLDGDSGSRQQFESRQKAIDRNTAERVSNQRGNSKSPTSISQKPITERFSQDVPKKHAAWEDSTLICNENCSKSAIDEAATNQMFPSEKVDEMNHQVSKQTKHSTLNCSKIPCEKLVTSNQKSNQATLEMKTSNTNGNKSKSEWSLTSTDISKCIDEIKSASGTLAEDVFADVDLAAFQITLENFQAYLDALSNSNSMEAMALKEIQSIEWGFVIFQIGMDVDYCNVCFICDMIGHIIEGIEESTGVNKCKLNLRCLVECMELTFGFSHDDSGGNMAAKQSHVVVSIMKTSDGASKLRFKRELSRPKQTSPSTSGKQSDDSMSRLLGEVSNIFEQYVQQRTWPLQSQLNSTQEALRENRNGAIRLQQTALDLQDQLQNAQIDADEAYSKQIELENQLSNQQYEFDKRLESFERVKEHYKRLLEQKERELAEVQCKLRHDMKIPDAKHSKVDVRVSLDQTMTLHDDSKRSDQLFYEYSRGRVSEGTERTKKNRVSVEPQIHANSKSNVNDADDSSLTSSKQEDRNPLVSLAVNSFRCHSKSDDTREDGKTQYLLTRGNRNNSNDRLSSCDESNKISKSSKLSVHSNKRQRQVENIYAKKSNQESNLSRSYEFKYQEVVRGKEARAALPAHECEACRKFNDAVYAQTGADMPGREQMVKECSRHRARFAPELTPADFWDIDFIDER